MFSRLFDNVWSGAAGSGQVRDVQKHAALCPEPALLRRRHSGEKLLEDKTFEKLNPICKQPDQRHSARFSLQSATYSECKVHEHED